MSGPLLVASAPWYFCGMSLLGMYSTWKATLGFALATTSYIVNSDFVHWIPSGSVRIRMPDESDLQANVFTDFEKFTTFKPDPRHEQEVYTMLDQLVSWARALQTVRTS